MTGVWLYAQGFHDPGPDGRRTDRLLTNSVGPAMRGLARGGLVDRYHVLRYSEGGFHLRVRVRTWHDRADSVWRVLDDALADCRGGGRRATYQPELSKYGGPRGLDLAERWFTSSTDFALGVLAASPTASERVVVCASMTLGLLVGLGLHAQALSRLLDQYQALWASHGFVARAVPLTDGRLPSQLCCESLDRWEQEADAFVHELRVLRDESTLGCSQAQFLLNMAHLTNNRIGLPPGGEMAMVDLIRTLLSAGSHL